MAAAAAAPIVVVVVLVIDAMIIDGLRVTAFTLYRSISESFLMANSSFFVVVVVVFVVLIYCAMQATGSSNKMCAEMLH